MATQTPAPGPGWTLVNGGWLPPGMDSSKLSTGATPTNVAATAPKATAAGQLPGSLANDQVQTQVGQPKAAQTIPGQAAAASSYSTTPTASPTPQTTNQGTQDVVRNSYLQQATQGTAINPNDPNIKAQTDPYNAGVVRGQRLADNEAAERLAAKGMGGSGALVNEQRLNAERSGQMQGQFAATVAGNELKNRRDEIQNALTSLAGMISNDQKDALQKQLADMDNAIKQQSLVQSGQLGNRELDIKEVLGRAGISADMLKTILGHDEFGTTSGIRIGEDEASNYFKSIGL